MKRKNNPINELAAMLAEDKKTKKKKPLLEGYLSEEDFDPSMGPNPSLQGGGDDDFPLEGMEGGEGDAMAQEQGILPIKNEIDQIRQIALKTIARLAENPVSESYQMMKKIWMMCDKAIESALQPEEGNKKGSGFLYRNIKMVIKMVSRINFVVTIFVFINQTPTVINTVYPTFKHYLMLGLA